ncbi:MAG: hypothetical protein GY754_23845 [bacterium]|nr:hypothetical protein [bacterium]
MQQGEAGAKKNYLYPCSCRSESGPLDWEVIRGYKYADAVFVGYVEKITPEVYKDSNLAGYHIIRFKVKKQWKGLKRDTIFTRIEIMCCVCGYEFKEKTEFLVYAHKTNEKYYSASTCSRTEIASKAKKDIAILNNMHKKIKTVKGVALDSEDGLLVDGVIVYDRDRKDLSTYKGKKIKVTGLYYKKDPWVFDIINKDGTIEIRSLPAIVTILSIEVIP